MKEENNMINQIKNIEKAEEKLNEMVHAPKVDIFVSRINTIE